MPMFPLSTLTVVKLGAILLGAFNLALILKGPPRPPSITEPRQIHIKNHPSLQLLHLDTPPRPRALKLVTEETAHYPINGTLADLEWASLVPAGNYGLVLLGPDSDARPYAVTMFHTLHCLDRIRQAIVSGGGNQSQSQDRSAAQARYHAHHCFNYVRQMVLCAANTRLNPTNHVLPSGKLASDGIGLAYECRDWEAVYEAYEANYTLNRTMSFT